MHPLVPLRYRHAHKQKKITMNCIYFLLSLAGLSLEGTYRRAEEHDIPALLALIKEQAIHDSDKIVILPEPFREKSLRDAIKKRRLFVAEFNNTLVGYKKLFLIEDEQEKDDILRNELRCLDAQPDLAGHLSGKQFTPQAITHIKDLYDVCIYNGADFTAPSHRKQKINTRLTTVALALIKNDIKRSMQEKKAHRITMVYGLTHQNAGNEPCQYPDRTIGISRRFRKFIDSLGVVANKPFLHMRYPAFMPTFDPTATELKPRPDSESVAGFGCVLSYNLSTQA